jgi:hypothetical protein
MTDKNRGFFGVEREAWQKAITLGLNPAVAYLVLARFTAADQRTSPAGVNAIERYTGISRPRARAAIDALIEAGLAREIARNGPKHFDIGIRPKPAPDPDVVERQDLIWLPNEIVTGAGRETAPVELIRQCQDGAIFELFVALYDQQNMADESGVSRKFLWQNYDRERVFEYGQYVIFRFTPGNIMSSPASPLAAPFLKNFSSPQYIKAAWEKFWAALRVLQKLGLLFFVCHLVESDMPDAEIMFPCDAAGLPAEAAIAAAADRAARSLAANRIRADSRQIVPVLAHMGAVQAVGIARLTYRARTRNELAWAARAEKWQEIAEQFAAIDGEVVAFPTGQNVLKKTA